jgi:hypothetical protein
MKNSIDNRELMEEVFPLTDQVNLLSETSRYALDNLLASHFIDYGTKSNAKISINNNNNSNITNTNNTCNNITCSPLLSKKRQQSRQSFSRQSAQGMEHSGTSKI